MEKNRKMNKENSNFNLVHILN